MANIDNSFWYNYFKVYDILNDAYPYNDLFRDVLNNIPRYRGVKILDAGSGTGNHSIFLSNLGADVFSLDSSNVGLEIHINKYPKAKTILHDLSKKLPFKENYFDYVISLNTVCFIEKDKREDVFDEFYRVLKPGGLIIIVNLLYYFKPFKIFINHVKRDILHNGFLAGSGGVIKRFVPTIKMFYYSKIIKKHNRENTFFLLDEQKKYLIKANFVNTSESKKVFANQAVLNTASK